MFDLPVPVGCLLSVWDFWSGRALREKQGPRGERVGLQFTLGYHNKKEGEGGSGSPEMPKHAWPLL